MHVLVQQLQPLKLSLTYAGSQTTHHALPGETEEQLWKRVVGLKIVTMYDVGSPDDCVAVLERPGVTTYTCRARRSSNGTISYRLSETSRLLVMACSATKKADEQLLPAIDRYDGPSYKTVRKWRANHQDQAQQLDILILSAEFGLIEAFATEIPNYDRRMTRDRATELMPSVVTKLVAKLAETSYSSILVHLGSDYAPALGHGLFPQLMPVICTYGGIGQRNGQLKRWLETEHDPLHGFIPPTHS